VQERGEEMSTYNYADTEDGFENETESAAGERAFDGCLIIAIATAVVWALWQLIKMGGA
jgi:hypothetical protein